MIPRQLLYVALGVTTLCGGPAFARKWTDRTGQYSVEAEFVQLVGQTVKLKRSDGRVISVALEKLSRSDQQYALQLAQRSSRSGDWVSLFNGRDLAGWHGDPKLWRVENGTLVGEAPIGVHSFLATQKTYGDFVLKLKFKLNSGNSGIQIRSRELTAYKMSGPQVELLPDTRFLGGLTYLGKDKGTVMGQADIRQAARGYRRNGWNEYMIRCHGVRVTVKLNGYQTLDYVDRSGQIDRAGLIGLQLFSPKQPTLVMFKDIRIRHLNPPDPRIAERWRWPPPRPVPLPEPMPDARFMELQAGNDNPRSTFRPKHLSELADNRIGDARGPSLQLSEAGADPEGDPALVDHAAHFGFKWLRMDMGLYDLSELHISPGQDKTVTLLSDSGITVCLTLTDWDKTLPGGGAHPNYGSEKEIQRYLDYARFIVRHFKGRIQYYEILNEPPIKVNNYIKLARRVVPVIRQEDPQARILIGGAANLENRGAKIVGGGAVSSMSPHAREWMSSLLQSDLMPLVDAVSTHPMYGVSPQYVQTRQYYYAYPSLVRQMKQVAAAHGFKGEWIAEEMCWRTSINPHPDEPWQYTSIVAAKYYARGIVMHLGMGVVAGVADGTRGYEVRPIARVVQNLCTVMAGNRPTRLPVEIESDANRIVRYTLSLPNGDRLIAVWNDNVAVDHDRGVPCTVVVKGFSARSVTGIDVLYRSEQEMITGTDHGNRIIRNLLVKDYPIILKLTRGF